MGHRRALRQQRSRKSDQSIASRRAPGGAFTHSVVMRSKTGTVRYVEAKHDFTRKQPFAPLGR
jgi:hypothetical protein